MKYGSQFEQESVPGWSLHNLDYNALKHHIKVHTTRDQASAIAIPGQQDPALQKFEHELFTELCRQHDRVGLFVSSKADEIGRRLQYLSEQTQQLFLGCPTGTNASQAVASKKQRKFAKYEHKLLQCGDDIQALERFVDAQVIAFRKILKKYRKWTGSAALGSRFKDVVLSHPKSFTKRSFFPLQTLCEEILIALRAAKPAGASARPSEPSERPDAQTSKDSRLPPAVVNEHSAQQEEQRHEDQVVTSGYWNEYDDGSEAGDFDRTGGRYVIYVNPDERSLFPGVGSLASAVAVPLEKMRTWFQTRTPGAGGRGERQSLLPAHAIPYGSTTTRASRGRSCLGSSPGADTSADSSDPDTESEPAIEQRWQGRRGSHGYASSEDFPVGYAAHYAVLLPSINEQRLTRHRERVLAWGTAGCYTASALFLSVAAILATSGRHRLRVEVDAGVTLGVMASLGCGCAGLAMTFSRRDVLGLFTRLAVWVVFAVLCVLNGVMLVFVVGISAS